MKTSCATLLGNDRITCGRKRLSFSMSHMCSRIISEKEKVSNFFDNPCKTTDENSCSLDCRCLNHHLGGSKADGQHNKKRLRKRKERSQMRGCRRDASKTKPRHHYCQQNSKDMPRHLNCCHSSCRCPSRGNAPVLSIIPAAQEPSIITESRLIGHRGLFNHEVKSIDIERLLTEQRKMEKEGKQAREKINAAAPVFHITSPLCSGDLFDGHTEELEKKVDLPVKSDSQVSNITPGQKSQQRLDPSSGSNKISVDVEMMKSSTADSAMSEMGKVSQLRPVCETENMKMLKKKEEGQRVLTLENTPENEEPPVHQTHALGLSPSPIQLSSSPIEAICDTLVRKTDPDCVFKSVSAVAARLSCRLQFPLLTKRNLLSETREVLLKALQEQHGPYLQENLLKVQQCLSFDMNCVKTVQEQNQRPVLKEEAGLGSTDAFAAAFQADKTSHSSHGTQKTTSFVMTGSKHFNWNSSPQRQLSVELTSGWLTSPEETSVNNLDDILRPSHSTQMCMDFEPFRASSSDDLFAPSLSSFWGATTSASQHWEDSFNRPYTKDSLMFDSYDNSFMKQTTAEREGINELHYSDRSIRPFFPNQTQLSDKHSAEPRQFRQEKDSFDTESSYAQLHQSHHFSHSPTCSSHRSHHMNMMNYPSSDMLEIPPLPPLPSPEDWSFPPMKLY